MSENGVVRRTAYRVLVLALAGAQVLLGVPVAATAAPARDVYAEAAPAQPDPSAAVEGAPPGAEAGSPAPPAAIQVNRTVPKVAPPPLRPAFSSEPTQGELLKARVFEEPLVPIGTTPTAEENSALARVVNAYVDGGAKTVAPIEAILEGHAVAPYRASLLLNLGLVYVRAGRPSRAVRLFREAWAIAKTAKDPMGTAVGDRALAELVRLLARSAEINELNRLLADIQGRDVRGPAGEVVQQGREAAYLMATQPDTVFRCGPLALQRLLAYTEPGRGPDARLLGYRASHWGIGLGELQELSQQAGLDYQMAKRVDHSSTVVVPAVVHWNLGHFAALVAERDGNYLILDPVFNDELWISREALNDEMSGYALVPRGALPRGWREVPPDEAKQVWGRGLPSGGGDPGRYGSCEKKQGGDQICPCSGMARYAVHSMLVSLNVVDTPVGYAPPRGPAVNFTVTYNQRESLQPQIFTYWNLGPMWTTDWLAWVTDDPTNLSQPATAYMRGGGYETYTGYNSSTSSYAVAFDSRAVLVRVSSSPIRYERRLPNGSVEEYAQPDGAVANPRKVFLTRVVDPQGNALSFTYDSSLRLVAVVDSLNQVTTLSYELPSDPLKVTKVTDPFGRFAAFSYNASGRLAQITDVIGLQSSFEYGAADFISALVTPYGRTTFTTGTQNADRWVVATDPLGGTERVEYRASASLPAEAPPPQGFSSNYYMNYRNTFYWDKRSSSAAGDYTKAHLMHWLHAPDTSRMSGTLESEKRPLENRVWYAYPGQASNARFFSGTLDKPSTVARVLDDGSTQTYQYEYNVRGLQTKETDPLGRETVYVYGNNNVPDANPTTGEGMDLLQVKRKNGATYDLLRSYTYNDKHQPLTITDARGAVTTYTYNAAGQVLTVQTPPVQGQSQGPTTTFNYDTNAFLQNVTGPVPGASTAFTYDAYGRKRTSTDATGLTLTYDYDAFDRVTRVTYPDTTYEQTTYKWLDADKRRDRLGRWTQTFYDAMRRPVAVRDARGGTTQYQYGAAGCTACSGGGDRLTKLIDANGSATSWEYDNQGRVTQETRANGAYETYTYETTTSRLKQKTDRRNITTTFEYFLDGKLKRKSYSDTTPAVSYTYDPVAGLMLTAANGSDTLTWTYDNLDRVATEVSTKNASTVGYTYDDAGNRGSLSLDGSTYLTYGYDPQSRLTSITRGANVFGFGYDTPSRRTSMTYPNGVVTTYGYDGESRLTSIAADRGSTPITSFTYVLDAAGNRTRKTTLDWAEDYGYDETYRLVSADRSGASPTRWRWAYDAVGNRTADQTGDASNGSTFNNLNQLQSRAPGGALAFRGTTNEPATVTIAGQPATTTAANAFSGSSAVGAGNTDVAVAATDAAGNTRTTTYRVSESGATESYTYDPNGNLATKTEGTDNWVYTWNALDELTKVEKNAAEVARFSYDPLGRRVEKVASGVSTMYGYDSHNIVREARAGSTRKYVQGQDVDEPIAVDDGTAMTYFHADALGSIAKETSGGGAVMLARQYDAWGDLETGASEPGYAFTGREWDPEAGLYYYRARYYDSKGGRFISEDPIEFLAGNNFYAYVDNDPVALTDPLGLESGATYRSMWCLETGLCRQDSGCADKAAYDFLKNYWKMRKADTIGADKYFHCMANCEASKRGPCGCRAAEKFSDAREWFDMNVKGDPAWASAADQAANRAGRNGNPQLPCNVVCAPFRPKGLAPQY